VRHAGWIAAEDEGPGFIVQLQLNIGSNRLLDLSRECCAAGTSLCNLLMKEGHHIIPNFLVRKARRFLHDFQQGHPFDAIYTPPIAMGAVGAVRAFRKVLLLAAPAVQQRAAGALVGLGRILDVPEAPNAFELLGAAGGSDRNPPGHSTTSSGSRRVGLGGSLLGLLAHRWVRPAVCRLALFGSAEQ